MSVLADSFEDQVPATSGRHPAAGATGSAGSPARVETARVETLRVRSHLRSEGLDERHVAALAELEGRWPPILVWGRNSDVVLDGAHRLAAAKRIGRDTVEVIVFHGNADEAFVETVRRNIGHGLPLSVPDRAVAAQQVLRRHPDWSDRRIAEACGLSPHTVARLRASLPPADTSSGEGSVAPRVEKGAASGRGKSSAKSPAACSADRIVDIESRLGRDGKNRPAQPGLLRDRVVEALRANPAGSLRQIASVAKVSPETVRRIRREVEQPGGPEMAFLAALHAPEESDTDWHEDPALCVKSDLVRWLDRTDPCGDLEEFALSVPLSRVYQLSDEARRRAARWAAFAEVLEGRARARSRGYSAV